jgi:hypothetical protein
VNVLACSGAISRNIWSPNFGNDEPSQIDKLASVNKNGDTKAVVMTLGGNDANFRKVVEACLAQPVGCDKFVGLKKASAFENESVGSESSLPDLLETAYAQINNTLNSRAAVDKRGHDAPILVLAYPIPIPERARTCAPMGISTFGGRFSYLLNGSEIEFVARFAEKLNAVIESAVITEREQDGVPVFFVPTTERAFQPSHTACDVGLKGWSTEPFARSVASINGAGDSLDEMRRKISDGHSEIAVLKSKLTRSIQELVHPNVNGYAAETLAIIRWTTTPTAADSLKFTRAASPATEKPLTWNVSDVDLGQLAPNSSSTIQGGTQYPLTVGGFAPDSQVELSVHSKHQLLGIVYADANGVVNTHVAIPRDLDQGAHTLTMAGADPSLHERVVAITFAIRGSRLPAFPISLAALSLAALLLGVATYLLSRRALRRGARPVAHANDESTRG